MDYAGLSTQKALKRREKYGENKVEAEKPSFFVRLYKKLISPIILMLIAAAIVSFVAGETFDFYFILVLLVLNIGISIWHEQKADKAIEELQNKIDITIRVLRDGSWAKLPSRELVPDDVIKLNVGDIVPADADVLEEQHLMLNESALTGESLSQEKGVGDTLYTGTYLETGYAVAVVRRTGLNTTYGKTIDAIEGVEKRSLLEQEILRITKYLSILSVVAIIALVTVFVFEHVAASEILLLALSVLLAGIPISLPTVMTLIISIGIMSLARQGVIVRRVSSLENLANVDLLLTDKTGTLTKNEINLVDIIAYSGFTKDDALRCAWHANAMDDGSISEAMKRYIGQEHVDVGQPKVIGAIPHDSVRKRSTVLIEENDMAITTLSFGAPQVIEPLLAFSSPSLRKSFEADVEEAAKKGYRALVISLKHNSEKNEVDMTPVGLLLFSDVLRDDAANVLNFMCEHGINSKIITGDNHAISMRIAEELKLKGKILSQADLQKMDIGKLTEEEFNAASTFSEVLPIQKLNIVEWAKQRHIVAMTGDGVNDIPPVAAADVGIAVSSAVSSLKSTADIMLSREGISYVMHALTEARKIFSRVQSYAVYRMSESIRIVFAILILALMYHQFPVLPIQLIILALMNDIPIITLAFNHTKTPKLPPREHKASNYVRGTLFGLVGLAQSVIFVLVAHLYMKLDWSTIQTLFFLKLSISGHMLIYVAHTRERWFAFLPSRVVIIATVTTQIIATTFAFYGIFMTAVSGWLVVFVWIWAIIWMQVAELMKDVHQYFEKRYLRAPEGRLISA